MFFNVYKLEICAFFVHHVAKFKFIWTANLLVYIKTIVLFLFIFGNFISGCTGLGKRLESPKVTISNIQLEEAKAFESILQIELRVFNINDIPITIRGIDCELEINGRRFAIGVSDDVIKIPSFATETIPIQVYSSVLAVFKGLIGLQKEERLIYRIKGKIHIDSDSLIPSIVPFMSEGKLSFDHVFD